MKSLSKKAARDLLAKLDKAHAAWTNAVRACQPTDDLLAAREAIAAQCMTAGLFGSANGSDSSVR